MRSKRFTHRVVQLGCAIMLIAGGGTQILHASEAYNTNPSAVEQSNRITVKGTVIDTSGETVIGATVMLVEDTSKGMLTNMDGQFTLNNVPSNGTIRVSYVGMKTVEVPINGKTSLSITLQADNELLEELVVVGYTTQRKESLTGSLQSLSNDQLKGITNPSVENLLTSKAPGVYVAPGGGQPGSKGAIVIRGKTTISGSTDPLWVIDGVIVGNSAGALNPSDIESMTVLKDAASTAIYGSQGANGVIVVTTKSAKSDKITIGFSGKAGVTRISKGNLRMMNGSELYDLYRSFSNQEMVKFPRWKDDLRDSNFDWWDFASQTGVVQDYSISLNGGTDKLRNLLSMGVYNETGAVKGYKFERYNFLFKSQYKPFDWLTVKPQIMGAWEKTKDQQHSVSAMYSSLPWDAPYDADGNIVPHRSQLWVNSNTTNYIYDLQWNEESSNRYEFMGNFDFDVRITDWLTFSSVNNLRLIMADSRGYQDPRSNSGEGVSGRLTEYRTKLLRRYTNQLLRFNKLLGDHSLNGILAYEYNDYRNDILDVAGTGFVPNFKVLDVTAKPEKTKGNISEWAVQSVFANFNYAYDSRYLAQVSLRRDGASNFGRNAKYGNFFSVSGGWNIHREAFFKSDIVNELKLRVSYGSVGNRPSALYPQYNLYSISSSASYNGESGMLISQKGNDNLTWEKSYTTGVGLNLSLWDRVRFTLDYYDKNTSQLLYEVPVTGLTGITKIWRNVGGVRNRGFEAIIGVDILKSSDLLWSFDSNIGLNRNKVTELYGIRDPQTGQVPPIMLGDGVGIAGSAQRILREGIDADTWYIPEWAGVNPENGAPQWYTNTKDADGNLVKELTSNYAKANKVELGSYNPNFFGGFSTSLTYKGFDANMVFGFSVGGKIYNYTRSEYDSDGAYTDRNQMKLMPGWSRWQQKGDNATHPLPSYNNSTNSQKVSSRYLEDGSYLKMRTLSMGYNFALPQYKISNIRVSLTGENLFTLTKYSGVDPELPSYQGKIVGATSTVYPNTRKFVLGLDITF